MDSNKTLRLISRLSTMDESRKEHLMASIKREALKEIRSALKKPVYC